MKPASAERASETRLTPGQVGERIRAMRLERGWRQADLAELVNVTQPYVGMIERGTISHPSSDVREAFALALGENAFGDFGLALEAREGTLGLVDAAAYLGVDHVTLRESEIACRREGHRYEYAIDELDAARRQVPLLGARVRPDRTRQKRRLPGSRACDPAARDDSLERDP